MNAVPISRVHIDALMPLVSTDLRQNEDASLVSRPGTGSTRYTIGQITSELNQIDVSYLQAYQTIQTNNRKFNPLDTNTAASVTESNEEDEGLHELADSVMAGMSSKFRCTFWAFCADHRSYSNHTRFEVYESCLCRVSESKS